MRITLLALIVFSFFATFVDRVVCIGHNFYGADNLISFVKVIDSNTETG